MSRTLSPAAAGGPGNPGQAELSARLSALEQVARIGAGRAGPDGFPADLLASAGDVLSRAGQRLRMSAGHTVVSLAGGTGSGKSSLFNLLAGADFSPVGVTRPVTREPHACAWDMAGAGPLLEWLRVPARHRYARASELGGSDQSMTGLILLDLPDHDSVLGHENELVDHLVGSSDMILWILDPQKYADASVHRRFLVPLAGHSEVVAVVLNQCDLLTPPETEECAADLRALLDSEGVPEVPVLVSSAVTGQGLDDLRALLARAVSASHASSARTAADVGTIAARFAPFAGPAPAAGDALPESTAAEIGAALADAAGADAIGDALASARELRAADYAGWPVGWLATRLASRDPARRVQLGAVRQRLRQATAAPSGTQQAAIDNALTWAADNRVPALPLPWARTVRQALRSNADTLPGAVSAELTAAVPSGTRVAAWWRAVGIAQGLLLGCAIVGLCWLACLLVLGVGGADRRAPALLAAAWLLPVAAVLLAGGLAAGWYIARTAMRAVAAAASRESRELAAEIRRRLTGVARELVVIPAERELAELGVFREELRAAGGDLLPQPGPETRPEAEAAQPDSEPVQGDPQPPARTAGQAGQTPGTGAAEPAPAQPGETVQPDDTAQPDDTVQPDDTAQPHGTARPDSEAEAEQAAAGEAEQAAEQPDAQAVSTG